MAEKSTSVVQAITLTPRKEFHSTHNPLLIKHVVGRARTTVYNLPDTTHIYGIKVEQDPLDNAAMGEFIIDIL